MPLDDEVPVDAVGRVEVVAVGRGHLAGRLVEGHAADIVYSDLFTGVHGNYLRGSIAAAGLDPDNLPAGDLKTMDFGSGGNQAKKAWRDIWGSGQGIGAVTAVESVAQRVDRFEREYREAKAALDAAYRG